jgi:glutamate dehydrogenase (NAD(P)+)
MGFGNAGQHAALLGEEILGLKLVAATDSRSGVYNTKGIPAASLVDYKLKNGTLAGFPDADVITNEELLALDVAVLFPAALENVIRGDNAGTIRARIVCELANGPTTPDADVILDAAGVLVLPDFLANAGGVTVSYFEQVQNAYNFYWELDEVHARLDQKMSRAFAGVFETAGRNRVNLREAAYLVAVARVAEACKLRGWV